MQARLFLMILLGIPSLVIGQQYYQTEVLVIGGSTGGTAAGVQAARSGVNTLIVEQTPWLGGMLTAAGVSCTDGNHALPSGLWQEFREDLYRHYGTRDLFTGWVSNTCFEPKVGDSIFKAWAAREPKLKVLYGWYFDGVTKIGNRVTGAEFVNKSGDRLRVQSRLTIDATDLGDAYASAGAGYDVGMEDPGYSKEAIAPGKYRIIQDLTWAATLQDYGPGANRTLPRPPGYDSTWYYCSCTDAPCNGKPWGGDSRKMLDYGKLPVTNNAGQMKYMLNWPIHGNDYTVDVVALKPLQREAALRAARHHTLGFVYFIQTRLGYKHIGLAAEFPTEDGLALMPYYREGRRLQGVVRMNVNHLTHPFEQPEALYRTGIAVGDYPVDHHHAPEKKAPEIPFPKVPSFNIPLGALIPAAIDGLIACEKGISVSNIVNGSTRLQPCVMLTGQAAGVLAALSVLRQQSPREVDVRAVQRELLHAKAFLLPYVDVQPSDPSWEAIQRIGSCGIIRGKGMPEGWANKTYFYPDSTMQLGDLCHHLGDFYGREVVYPGPYNQRVTHENLQGILSQLDPTGKTRNTTVGSNSSGPLTRKQIAGIIDAILDPFRRGIDLRGKVVQ